MPESSTAGSLPPRTHHSQRWPRKWATLGGRGTPSMSNGDELKVNGNGTTHRTSLFRKSSTISRSHAPDTLDDNNSLKKSRSLINVLRSKLNSPAVLRRFRTKSRENGKTIITEVTEETKKARKRDPSPMRRLTQRLVQLTRSQTQNSSIDAAAAPSPDKVDHINACYDEIRAKYFDSSTISALSDHPCAPPSAATERLKEMLSTTTASSVDYYDRPNPDRSLSNISINGSLLSHDPLNHSQGQNVPSSSPPVPVRSPDDPLLAARKQSNIKLNCLLSGYAYRNPFSTSNHEKLFGQTDDLFKFHHYHDVGKYKFDSNLSNRMYSSMRARPLSRSIDSFRRATTTSMSTDRSDVPSLSLVQPESMPNDPTVSSTPSENESEVKTCTSKIYIEPAASVQVKTFVTSSMPAADPLNDELERNFLRAVDRVLGLGQTNSDSPSNGEESPNVELVDRTGEDLDQEHWQTSAVYQLEQVKNEV